MSYSNNGAAAGSRSRPVSSLNLSSSFRPAASASSNASARGPSGVLLLGRKPSTLNKAPSGPRPVQLPSYKKESKGFDPAVSIVPAGQTTWKTQAPAAAEPKTPPPPPAATQQNDAPSAASQPAAAVRGWSSASVAPSPTPIPYSQRTSAAAAPSSDREKEREQRERDRERHRQQQNDVRRSDADRSMSRDRHSEAQSHHSSQQGGRRSSQWGAESDDDDGMDYSKPVVFADGTVVAAAEAQAQAQQRNEARMRERGQQPRRDDARYDRERDRDYGSDRLPRERTRHPSTKELDRSPSPSPPTQRTADRRSRAEDSNDAREYPRIRRDSAVDDDHQYMRERAAQRRAEREAEENARLQEQRRAAQAKLEQIERKLRASISGSAGGDDRSERRYSEKEAQPLYFGASEEANTPVHSSIKEGQKVTLMQRPRTASEHEQAPQQQPPTQQELVRKQQRPQLVTKIPSQQAEEPAPAVPAPVPEPVVEKPKAPVRAWKELPQVTQSHLINRPQPNEPQLSPDYESEQIQAPQRQESSASSHSELLAAASAQFSATESHRTAGAGGRVRTLSTNQSADDNRPMGSSNAAQRKQSMLQSGNEVSSRFGEPRRPVDFNRPRKWAAAEDTTPQQSQVQGARQPTVTVNGERVVNILDLAVDERGRPILPNFPSVEPVDAAQSTRAQRPERERKEKERKPKRADKQAAAPANTTDDSEVANINDSESAVGAARGQPGVRGRKSITRGGATRSQRTETSADSKADEADISAALAESVLSDSSHDELGFERVLTAKEKQQIQQQKREREEAAARERQKLARQQAYRQTLEKDIEAKHNQLHNRSTPSPAPLAAAEASRPQAEKAAIRSFVDAAKSASSSQQVAQAAAQIVEVSKQHPAISEQQISQASQPAQQSVATPAAASSSLSTPTQQQLLKQLQAAYPQLPTSQLEAYIVQQANAGQKPAATTDASRNSFQPSSAYSQYSTQAASPTSSGADQSNFMSMFRQSPAPSLSPSFSTADSPQLRSVLSPATGPTTTSNGGHSDEYVLNQNETARRDMAIRMLMQQNTQNPSQQQTQQQQQSPFNATSPSNFSQLNVNTAGSNSNAGAIGGQRSPNSMQHQQLFGGWNSSSESSAPANGNNVFGSHPFSGGFSQIQTLATHFNMTANGVAQLTPAQYANLQSKYQAQVGPNAAQAPAGAAAAPGSNPSPSTSGSDAFSAYGAGYSAFSGPQNALQQQQQRVANMALHNQPPFTNQFGPNRAAGFTTQPSTSSFSSNSSQPISRSPSSEISGVTETGKVKAPIPHNKKSNFAAAFSDAPAAASSSATSAAAALGAAPTVSAAPATSTGGSVPTSSRLHGWVPKSALKDSPAVLPVKHSNTENLTPLQEKTTVVPSPALPTAAAAPENDAANAAFGADKPRKPRATQRAKKIKEKAAPATETSAEGTAADAGTATEAAPTATRGGSTATRGRGRGRGGRGGRGGAASNSDAKPAVSTESGNGASNEGTGGEAAPALATPTEGSKDAADSVTPGDRPRGGRTSRGGKSKTSERGGRGGKGKPNAAAAAGEAGAAAPKPAPKVYKVKQAPASAEAATVSTDA